MKKFDTKIEPIEIKYNHRTYCDWCGDLLNEGRSIDFDFNSDDFKLEWRWGNSYPEGGSGYTIQVDLCRNCRNKLFNFLELKGCKIQKSEWDY